MASFSFGDSGGLVTNLDTPLNDQQLPPTALMAPEAGKRLSPQPRGGFGNAQKKIADARSDGSAKTQGNSSDER
jgi:hypothetical protein